jgi:hypothetical protein
MIAEAVLVLITSRFVHKHDEEFNALKKERRPGRPASTREDLLRIKIAADEKEYENGFCQSITSLFWTRRLIFSRSARPHRRNQCSILGQMGWCMVIFVDVKMGPDLEWWTDTSLQISP